MFLNISDAVWTKKATMAMLSLYEAKIHMLNNVGKQSQVWKKISEGLKDLCIQVKILYIIIAEGASYRHISSFNHKKCENLLYTNSSLTLNNLKTIIAVIIFIEKSADFFAFIEFFETSFGSRILNFVSSFYLIKLLIVC